MSIEINSGTVNIKFVIEYDGKNYSGWQRQKKDKSVQQKIEDALSVLFNNEKITITGAGRTDAGVHAYGQCANFRVNKKQFESFGKDKLLHSLNAVLPGDILVKKLGIVADNFSSRYSAVSREYIYRFSNIKRAINRDGIYYINYNIDLSIANEFCKVITGARSFKTLCKNKTDDHDFYCNIISASVKKKKDGIYEFKLSANRFLHSMVRALTGAMLGVSSGKMSLQDFTQKFKKGDEIKIQYVPSNALFLLKVNY